MCLRRPKSYSTTFGGTENPLSESGRWIDGATVGLSAMRMSGGKAYGTQTGTITPPFYNDSTTALADTWSANQYVKATCSITNPQDGTSVYEELELRVRALFSGSSFRAYGVNIRCATSGDQYLQLSRWLWTQSGGYAGDWAGPDVSSPSNQVTIGLSHGDVIGLSIVGSTLTAYINGVNVNQVTDTTYASGGAPGMAHWYHGDGSGGSSASDYGFTTFLASEGQLF